MDVRSVVRMLLGLKTAREREMDRAFQEAMQTHRNASQSLDETIRKIEAAQANIHARAQALKKKTGGIRDE